MGDLDFKFVAHRGEMVKQKMGGREELAGRDAIAVHRLLKNKVSEKVVCCMTAGLFRHQAWCRQSRQTVQSRERELLGA